MEALVPIVIVLVLGIALIVFVRWSRRNWERREGKPTIPERVQSFGIFLVACIVFGQLAHHQPVTYLACFGILTFGLLPIGRERRGLVKDILDMGFLAIIIVAPFALVARFD